MDLPIGLLEAVKNYLDITWDDPEGDVKLSGITARGIEFLDRKAGTGLDYTVEGMAKELLLEYCRYTRNGMLNEFMINYAPFLQDLRAGNGGAYGQETTNI